MTVDPNLYASLATNYLGGIRAPSENEAGFVARANAAGDNLEYVAVGDLLESLPMATAAGAVVGNRYQYHAQITTTDTATHYILTQELPLGNCHVWCLITGQAADGDYEGRTYEGMYHAVAGTATSIVSIDTDTGGTLIGSATVSLSGQNIRLQCTSDAGDGTVVWTATLEITHHT